MRRLILPAFFSRRCDLVLIPPRPPQAVYVESWNRCWVEVSRILESVGAAASVNRLFLCASAASLLKGLKHANIVLLHDIIHTKETLTLVFEYVVRLYYTLFLFFISSNRLSRRKVCFLQCLLVGTSPVLLLLIKSLYSWAVCLYMSVCVCVWYSIGTA